MTQLLWANLVKLLSAPLMKFGLAAMIAVPVAIVADAPVHDPFFDILGLIFLNAIVTGAPEPDMWKVLTAGEFFYLWFYRSSHGFLGSATAYFGHKNMWGRISGEPPAERAPVERAR